MEKIAIGTKIKITSDNDNYDKWRNKTWTITHLAYSTKDHLGYDSGVNEVLVDCKGLPVSLYRYEFKIVS